MGEKIRISALAIVLNEEHNIRQYLDNMSFADEIIVVDSFSSDNTTKIIQKEYTHVKLYQRAFDDFSSQRNYTLELATNDWVVFFDADERVTQKGIDEIITTVNSNPEEAAFWFKRIFYYKGRPMVNNSFNKDRAIRLFRKSKCKYSEKLVHETLSIKGKTGHLKESIHHYSFKSKEDFLEKRLQYSKLKAKELYQKGVTTNLYHLSVRPAFRFFKYYILGLGFLNGSRGLEIAGILGYHVYMRYVYLREMANHKEDPKILVIQQKMIGDVLASSIICANLKALYPKSTLDYLIYPFTKPVVENNPAIDNLVLFDQKYRDSKWKFIKFVFDIRKKNYDIVVDAYGILGSNIIVGFSKAKTRIGFYKSYSSFVYTHTVEELKTPLTNAGLALDNRMQLVRVLKPVLPLVNRPEIHLTQEEISYGRAFLDSKGIPAGTKVYMISVLGSLNIKTYPAAYMAQLLDLITQNSEAVLIFNYIPSQQKEAEELYNLCRNATKERIRMDISPGTIREFLSVLYHCNALIGNEGGAVNMAKALYIPTFTIFSTWIKKEAWNSFEDGTTTISVHLKDFKPELYGETSPKEMKPKAMELYNAFTPDLIIPALKKYIEIN
ncbi:glycosyltransferase [Flavobacterium sp. AG291]|uniref:glycosyltransferase n=1 Tax=Flavobacterium sp. AG291 TaxID=2184000 RepID=UPI000E0A80AB|nr:glycosyltransferase [Flavobacterium sp. AG291]RDI05781.1 ADP-heptose:LPS heptosyltransferase [Flavobacterium sp. AG291]